MTQGLLSRSWALFGDAFGVRRGDQRPGDLVAGVGKEGWKAWRVPRIEEDVLAGGREVEGGILTIWRNEIAHREVRRLKANCQVG
jgi:hypothetical protein